MAEEIGRREANRRATHAAIVDAARRLFSERGYEATSVREIAEAAGVGERTFYRYYDGKDALLAGEAGAWLSRLAESIEAQPAVKPMLVAVRDAMLDVREAGARDPAVGWLLGSQTRPLALLRRSAPRPLRRFEQAIEAALCARQLAQGIEEEPWLADLTARVSVAVIRAAAGRVRIGADDAATERSFWETVEAGFADLDLILASQRDTPGVLGAGPRGRPRAGR